MARQSAVPALTTALTAALVTTSLGQGPRVATTPWQDARMAAVARLEAGQRVRVEGRSAERVIGTFQRSGDGTVVLTTEGGERSLPIADMSGLWVRGSSWKTGLVVGGLIGAAGLGTFAGFVCGGISGTCTNRGGDVLLGAAVGAVGGGVTGSLIGAVIPKWHRRYP